MLAPGFMARRDDPDARRARLWLRGNNHWSPRAAEQAAREVAERLATWEGLGRGPLREGVDFTVARALVPVARRSRKLPATSPSNRGKACVRKRTFIAQEWRPESRSVVTSSSRRRTSRSLRFLRVTRDCFITVTSM